VALALDGAILNAAELRAQLERHGYGFAGEGEGAAAHAEVLLRAYQYWDKEVVKQLRGAFAFALWDARKDRLMLARDRFGQKPLYLAQVGNTLCFASESQALARLPGVGGEVDVGGIGDYLALGYVRGPRTRCASGSAETYSATRASTKGARSSSEALIVMRSERSSTLSASPCVCS
jgi:asparagine synthase (glutamine-hydrolysing)